MIRLLGEDVRTALLERLEPDRAASLRTLLAQPAPRISANRQLQLLEEFEQLLGMLDDEPPPIRLHRPDVDDASRPVSASPRKAPVVPPFTPSGDHLADLERINAHQVSAALEGEQPRTIAAILCQFSAERTAELLSLISDSKRELVVRELSNPSRTHPLLVERMAEAVLARAVTMPAEAPVAIDRLQRLAQVLRAVEKPMRKQMLDAIREQDAETAEGLLERLYEFSDIVQFKDRQVQKILTEINATMISTALAGADEAIRDKFLSNLSKRARESLLEEMSFQTEVPDRLVQEARKQVVATMARMDAED
ncbi:MAG: FliG C-terminal domain-containing protein [Planctomycetaceae bacterium]